MTRNNASASGDWPAMAVAGGAQATTDLAGKLQQDNPELAAMLDQTEVNAEPPVSGRLVVAGVVLDAGNHAP